MYTNEKTVEKRVCSRTDLNKCKQCVHGRRTQTNTVQCAARDTACMFLKTTYSSTAGYTNQN